jgi:hypothetical protein
MSDTIELIPVYGDDRGKPLIYNDDEPTHLAMLRGELVTAEDWADMESPENTIATVPMSPTVGDSAGDTLMYPANEDTQLAYLRGELDTVEGGDYDTTDGGDTTAPEGEGGDTVADPLP